MKKTFETAFIKADWVNDGKDTEEIFKKVLYFKVEETDTSFSKADFYEYLYYKKSFELKVETIKKLLNKDTYIYIHSYAKNGKSTFSHFLEHTLITNKYDFQIIDFAHPKRRKSHYHLIDVIKNEFRNLHKKYINSEFWEHPIMQFMKYVSEKGATKEFDNLTTFFFNSANNIISNYSEFQITENTKTYLDINLFLQTVEKSINEKIIPNLFKKPKASNEKRITSILLNLYFGIRLFITSQLLSKQRIVILLDNLDDIYTYDPENINLSYTNNIHSFIESLEKYYPLIFAKFKRKISFKFIFVYRTSNYLSTISNWSSLGDSNLSRINHQDTPIMLTSVNDSLAIIEKRLKFYADLCNWFEVKHCTKFELFQKILKAFTSLQKNSSDPIENKSILRLWNGNKLEFFLFLLEVNIDQMDLEIILNDSISERIKIEIIYFYFVEHYRKLESSDNNFANFIKSVFNGFDLDHTNYRQSLGRLLFTYIYNKRLKSGTTETHGKAKENGISLHNFIEELKNDFKKSDGTSLYSNKELFDMLDATFSYEVDYWGNFYSCCGPIVERENNKEYYKFRYYIKDILTGDQSAKNIKFYINDAGKYFFIRIRRSFEYYSISNNLIEDNSNQKLAFRMTFPRAILLNINDDNKTDITYEILINHVLSGVDRVAYQNYEVITNHFKHLSIDEYKKLPWVLNYKGNRNLYFYDVISRMIDYIEKIRYDLITHKFWPEGNLSKSKKQKINNVSTELATYIIKFIGVFTKYHSLYKEHNFNVLSDVIDSLYQENQVMEKLKSQANKVIKGEHLVKISTHEQE